MRANHLDVMSCPTCSSALRIRVDSEREGKILAGELMCSAVAAHRFPIRDSIPRFVPSNNYADNFGFQWNIHATTQLDSHHGDTLSRDRLQELTGWTPDDFADQTILEIGCGAGRFTEIILKGKPKLLVSIDYSSAVDACYRNVAAKENDQLLVLQADMYALPLKTGYFDKVLCLNVLQHTPDVEQAFHAIAKFPKHGGQLAANVYITESILSYVQWKSFLRPITKRMNKVLLYDLVRKSAPFFLMIGIAIDRLGRVPGAVGRKLIPVINLNGVLPLSKARLREWAILDTFDALSPEYDNPQRAGTLRAWMEGDSYKVFREKQNKGTVTGLKI